ncbi:MAG: hypothetical protein HOV80_31370 [Polyangiaceae bacterium]|nr:hypothetical protein [Polyangiaceae bacterium]
MTHCLARRSVVVAVAALVGAVACGGADVEDSLDRALRARADEVAPKSERLENVSAKARRGEEKHAFRVILKKDRCYVIAAAGDDGVKTIDLRVFDALGADAAKTNAPEPLVEVCAKISGPFRVVLDVTGRGRVRAAVFAKPQPKEPESTDKAPGDKTVRP